MEFVNENDAKKSAIHKIIESMYDMYGRKTRKEGYMTVFVGDQPTVKSLFWIFYDVLVEGEGNDIHKWGVPAYQSQVDFTTRKKVLLGTVKWAFNGTGMD